MNIFDTCPTFLSPSFTLRRVRREDAPGLLRVYSDRTAQYYFNPDNCPSDFRYTTLREMQGCIEMWIRAYERRERVRWTVLKDKKPVGTVEMFRREDGKDGKGLGVLRIDLMSMYEFSEVHDELLRTLLPEMHELFRCERILTKALPTMMRRRLALVLHGFIPCKEPLIGAGGIEYNGYWARRHILP